MAKTLLQEAIAEAKQLREAAIQNATKQLEENLTPSIKEMLAQKLEEELNLDENEEETQIDENSNSGFKEVKPKSTVKEADEDPEEDPADDAAADADAAADDADAAAADADTAADDADADAADADAAEGDPAEEEEQSDDTPLKDITLGDLRTLIQDIVAASAAPAPDGDLGADMDAGGVEGMGDEAPAGDTAASAEVDPTADPAADPAADPNADPAAEDDDEEIDISEILKELEEEEKCPECGKDKDNCICKENKANDEMPENQNGKEHHKEPNENGPSQDSELNELKSQLEEKEEKIKELEEGLAKVTKTLNDVNLLNGKLVYTTRLLNQQNLTESQKANVIKTLDSAKSAKEIKSLYKGLLEGLKNDKNVVTESRRGSASRPAGGSTASTILEGDEMVRRFQELAGIIKG